jgi:hypothetical protein
MTMGMPLDRHMGFAFPTWTVHSFKSLGLPTYY